MNPNKTFAAFILTHGRPDNVSTFETLRKCGYTGNIYLIIDNEDQTADQYRLRYGDENVLMFDKKAISKTFDLADTSSNLQTIVCARNASFQIAKDLGLKHFMQLDDDYNSFQYRYPSDNKLKVIETKCLDAVIQAMIKFLDDSGASTVAMAQGGDFIGGLEGATINKPLLRKAMNSFLFKTDNPITFVGRINEDVNTYVLEGSRGKLYFTTTAIMLTQDQTQKNKGGMTETYLESGTYLKSFYTVIMHPSSVTARTMGTNNKRLHHHIKWNNTTPKIINQQHRKQR
jgi:hypothetical protein